jgi:hypothetical protein
MKQPLLCSVGIAFLLSTSHMAHAQEITFRFTGVITVAGDPRTQEPFGPFEVGQLVEGSYTFDTTAVDQDPSDIVGQYESVIRFDYSVPAANFAATASAGSSRGRIEVLNNDEGVRDRYGVHNTEPRQNLSGPEVAGHAVEGLSIVMRDRTTFAVSSDALPLVPPTLLQFADGAEIFLNFFDAPGVIAGLTSLTVSSSVTDLLNDLVQRVISLNVQGGISNSFDAKLDAVVNAIDDSNEKNNAAAQNAMHAFINAVEAQRGKKLTDTQVTQLVNVAQAIIAALGG